jgi:hypothetical protein
MGERRGVYRVFVRKTKGKTPLIFRHTWEDNIKTGLKEIGSVGCGLD